MSSETYPQLIEYARPDTHRSSDHLGCAVRVIAGLVAMTLGLPVALFALTLRFDTAHLDLTLLAIALGAMCAIIGVGLIALGGRFAAHALRRYTRNPNA